MENDYFTTFDQAQAVELKISLLKTKMAEFTQKLVSLEANITIISGASARKNAVRL